MRLPPAVDPDLTRQLPGARPPTPDRSSSAGRAAAVRSRMRSALRRVVLASLREEVTRLSALEDRALGCEQDVRALAEERGAVALAERRLATVQTELAALRTELAALREQLSDPGRGRES